MTKSPGVYLNVDKRSYDGALQVSINLVDTNGGGHGYRIAGPKYDGFSKTLLSNKLTTRDVKEIRAYLDRVEEADRLSTKGETP